MAMGYEMRASVALDTMQANKNANDIQATLRAMINTMKATSAQAASTGDQLGAQSTKFEGLGRAIELANTKIEVLRSKQNELDTSTAAGARAFERYESQIASTQRQVANYTSQQERAKDSMQYYSSGLADLQHSYQMTIDKTEAYANRLKAEGDDLGANKAKLSGYKDALSNLTEQYEKQSSELQANKTKVDELNSSYNSAKNKLDELKNAGKENSDEYKQQTEKVNELKSALGKANDSMDQQKIRVDKTGTSIAETKSKTNELSEAVGKEAPQGFFSSMFNGFHKTGEETEKTKGKVSGMMSYFAGGALLNGVNAITGSIQEQMKAGYEDAKAADSFGEKFKNMGLNKKGVDDLGASIKQIKENSNISGGAVTALTQKFYGMTGSVKQTEILTKGVGSLTDQLHLSGQQSDAFAGGLSKIESSGKVTAGALGKLEKQAPGLGVALQRTSGMSKDAFDKLVASGKMTSSQFNDILEKSSKNFDKNSKEFDSTADGSMHHLQTSFADTRKSLMKPLVEVSNTGLSALSSALDNPATQKAVEGLGKGIADLSKKVADLINYVAGHAKDITSIIGSLSQIVGLIGSGVWDAFKGIIDTISSAFNKLAGNSKKTADPIHSVANGLQEISKWQGPLKVIGATMATMFVVSKIVGFSKAIYGLIEGYKALRTATTLAEVAQVQLDAATAANPIGLVVVAITAAVASLGFAIYEVHKHWDSISKAFSAGFNSLVKGAGSAIGNITKTFGQFFSGIGKLLGQASKAFGSFIGGVVNLFKNNWKQIGLFILNPFAGIAAMLYKNVKPFRDFVNSVFNIIKTGFGAIGNFFGGFWNGIKNVFNTSLGFITKNWSSSWNGMKNIVSSIFGGIANFFGGVWNGIKSLFSSSLNFVTSLWNNSWNTVSNIGKSIWNGITSFLGGFWNGIKSVFNSSLNWVSNIWNNSWNGIFNFGKGIWNGIKNAIGGLWDGIKNVWNSSIGFIVDKWKGAWDTITGVIKGAISAVHHAMVDIARGVLKPINEMLKGLKDGINWVLDKVGADKISAKWEISMPAYAKGTGNTHPGGLAKVNDAPSSNYREMYQLPSGQIGMFPDQRNMIVNLPEGTSVLDGERSANLASMMGIPAYKDGIGSVVGNIANTVTGAFKGIWDKGADLMDMVDDILKKPAEFLSTVFEKFVGIKDSKIGLANDVITHFPSTVAKSGVNWIKGLIQKMKDDAGGDVTMGAVGNYNPDQIRKAADQMHVSLSDHMLKVIQSLIQNESGGNAGVTQHGYTDVNSGSSATLARGLLQYVPSTFANYAVSGHSNIFNAYDQLLALFNDSNWEHDIHPGGGWSPTGHRRMANGGYVGTNQMIEIAEGNKGEFVIPTDLAKRPRAMQLLGEITTQFASETPNNVKSALTGDNSDLKQEVSDLKDTVKEMVKLTKAILGNSSEQIDAIYKTASDPQVRWRYDAQQGTAKSYQDYRPGGAY